jgi:AcrR family transcriptional regulator
MIFVVIKVERNGEGGRRLRSDAVANQERLLASAAVAIRREGAGVPMSTIASDAGVGVGTLYRHYPSREALLAALTDRSFRMVLGAARRAATDESAIECIRRFLDDTIQHGAELVLPMHGGPVPVDQANLNIRAEVHDMLDEILRRGRQDRTIRPDVRALDIVMFAAMIAQQLPTATHWKRMAHRQAAIFLDGLATLTTTSLHRRGDLGAPQDRSTQATGDELRPWPG